MISSICIKAKAMACSKNIHPNNNYVSTNPCLCFSFLVHILQRAQKCVICCKYNGLLLKIIKQLAYACLWRFKYKQFLTTDKKNQYQLEIINNYLNEKKKTKKLLLLHELIPDWPNFVAFELYEIVCRYTEISETGMVVL